jgi:hypothetical protein
VTSRRPTISPSLTIARKELDQLEDYVNSILAQPDFVSTSTSWNFYLVTSEYDDVVKERITQENRATGLFIDKPNHKVWVKSWVELLRDAEGRLKFVQDQLRIEVSAEEIEMRIAELKASVLKSEALDLGEVLGETTEAKKGRLKQTGKSSSRPPPAPP